MVTAILKGMGVRLLIHQPPYSMLRRDFETGGLFDTLDELGIGSICFSPLAQGLLSNKYLNGIPEKSRIALFQGFGIRYEKTNLTEAVKEAAMAVDGASIHSL